VQKKAVNNHASIPKALLENIVAVAVRGFVEEEI